MPGIVNRLATPETVLMLGDDLTILSDHDAVGVSVHPHRVKPRIAQSPCRLEAWPPRRKQSRRRGPRLTSARAVEQWA
jgi:hypothetical protein